MFSPKRILVPTDFSNYSCNALRQAADIAQYCHAQVYLVHVIDQNLQRCVTEYGLSNGVIREIQEESMTHAIDSLRKTIDGVTGYHSPVEFSFEVKQGVPFNEILLEQEAKNIDLIVMASHGETGMSNMLIGSVAEKVIRNAKCPVLLLRN